MSGTKSTDCKQRFIDAAYAAKRAFEEIDADTPFTDTEPDWWLEMRNLEDCIDKAFVSLGDPYPTATD